MKKLTKKTYWIYGIGVSYFILDQLYIQWLPYYYLPPSTEKNLVPLLKPEYLVIAFIIARIIDAVSDPLVGYWSDNLKSKFGRRSFFMLIGGLPLGILMIMYFYPPKFSQNITLLYLSIVGGLFFVAYTLVGGPYNALIPDLAETKEEGLNLSTVQSVFRLIFTGIALILPGILIKIFGGENTEEGIRKTVILLTIFAIIGVYSCIFFLKENKISNKMIDIEKNKKITFKDSIKYLKNEEIRNYFLGFFMFFCGFNILRGVLTYYLIIIMGLPLNNMTIITAILFGTAGIFFPITNILSKKFTYKKVLILDIVLLIIGTVGLVFTDKSMYYLAYGMFIICGMGLSGSAFIFPQAMLSEISYNLSNREKVSLEGFLFGIQGLFLKLAFLVQQVIISLVIVYGSTPNRAGLRVGTELGVRVSLIIALFFFGISIFFYKLKKD